MSVPVLIGFAGVLVAAVATGMLAGRCVRQPRIDFIVWTAATLSLTIALAAQSMGIASGFGPATFRAVLLFGLALAPLWLAWGLVELVAADEAARFGMRLAAAALTVVASVILATEPLTAQPFGQAWPLTGPHVQPISHYVLDVVQAVAVLAVVVSAGLAAARARSDPPWRPTMTAAVPVGLAVLLTAGSRFPLPARAAYPLLSAVAAALVWFGVSRVGELPATRRDGRVGGVRDDKDRYRSGNRPEGDYWPDDAYEPAGIHGPGGDYAAESRYATYGRHGQQASAGESPAAAAPSPPYGRILIFTLLEDRVADFDRLAEQTAEEVRMGEPGTLVYVIHLVPNAPMQRIFYEIYRDRAAFDRHESQPYMQRFVAERRSCVLATNAIELRLKYAKVAPLPAGPPAGARGPAGPPGPQRLQPLPPARPQRPDPQRPDPQRPDPQRPDPQRPDPQRPDPQRPDPQRPDPQRPDPQRPDPQRPDQWRPGQRQVPSAGRRYGG